MSGHVVFVTMTDFITVPAPTSFTTLSSQQPSETIDSSSSKGVSTSKVLSANNSTTSISVLTTITALPTEFEPPIPISTTALGSGITGKTSNGNQVEALVLASMILVILLYLFVIIAFILFWIRKECHKCQTLGTKLRNPFHKTEDAGIINQKDLEGQSESEFSSQHDSWPVSCRSSESKEKADSVMDGFEKTSIDIDYPRPFVVSESTSSMRHDSDELVRASEEVDCTDFVPYDKFVNPPARPYSPQTAVCSFEDSEDGDEDAKSLRPRRRYDSDGFLRITPPRTPAVNGLASKAAVAHPGHKPREIVKLVYRRDSQGVWGYLPPLFPPLAVPKPAASSKTSGVRPVVLSRTPTNDSLAQPSRTAAYDASRLGNPGAKAAKEEHDRLEKIRKSLDRMQTIDLDADES